MTQYLIALFALFSTQVFASDDLPILGRNYSPKEHSCTDRQIQAIHERATELALSEIHEIEISKNANCSFKKTQFNSISRIYVCDTFKVIVKLKNPSCNSDSITVREVVIKY